MTDRPLNFVAYASRLLPVIIALCMSHTSFARIISAESALARALSTATAVNTNSMDSRQSYRLAFTSPDIAYYVFTTESGSALVASADDSVEPVLAEIPGCTTFSTDSLAPGAAWMLEMYRRQIAALRRAEKAKSAKASPNSMTSMYSQWHDIQPIMTCSWTQRAPYNQMCPVKDGSRCVTGCVATAMAQVIRTIGYAECSGFLRQGYGSEYVEYDFDNTPVDFDNLPDVCSVTDPQPQRDAVARLMLACGLSVGMSYSPSESGAQSTMVDYALINNFGYDSTHTRFLSRSSYTTAKWESIIYAELSLGRPVYYSATAPASGGHAFVIDGYRGQGLWHVNWGWGRSDGYFSLALLDPAMTDDVATGNGYNVNQNLVKAVPPGHDPGVVISTMFGSISLVSANKYQVYYSGRGVAHENVDLGAAVVRSGDDQIIEWVPFWRGQSMGSAVSIRDSYTFDFTTLSLPAGVYRIYPATKPADSDIAVVCAETDDRQYYVNLTVTPAGEYEITNPEDDISTASYDLHVSQMLTPVIYSGFSNRVRFVVVNNGGADYLGTIALDLIDGSSDVVYSKTVMGSILPAGDNALMGFTFYGCDNNGFDLPEGDYRIRLSRTNGEVLTFDDTCNHISVIKEVPSGYHSAGGLTEVRNASTMPSYLVSGEMWTHVPFVDNERDGSIQLDLVFYRPGSNMAVKRYTLFNGELGYISGLQHYSPFTVDLPFGLYEVCYEANRIDVSERCTVSIGDKVGDYYFIPVDSDKAEVCRHPEAGYTDVVIIPSSIVVGGAEFTVTAVADNAFSDCKHLTAVVLPRSVVAIGRNAFAYCDGLQDIVIGSKQLPLTQRNHAMPGASSEISIYAPAADYNQYLNVFGDYQKVYAAIESIESRTVETGESDVSFDVAISPAHHAVNPDFVITPIDDASESVFSILSAEVVGSQLRISVRSQGSGVADYLITSAQPGVEPAVLRLISSGLAGIEEVEGEAVDRSGSYYDMLGRPALGDVRGAVIEIGEGKPRKVMLR